MHNNKYYWYICVHVVDFMLLLKGTKVVHRLQWPMWPGFCATKQLRILRHFYSPLKGPSSSQGYSEYMHSCFSVPKVDKPLKPYYKLFFGHEIKYRYKVNVQQWLWNLHLIGASKDLATVTITSVPNTCSIKISMNQLHVYIHSIKKKMLIARQFN